MDNQSLNRSFNDNNIRYDEIDVAKGIGILLVIFFHIHDTGRACDIVYSFHMPLFFFISGFLFNKKKYKSFGPFFRQRLKTLLCPYLLFMLLSLGLWIFVHKIYWGDGVSSILDEKTCAFFKEIFIARQSGRMTFNTPMWFVPCLFLVEMIYYFLAKIKKMPNLCGVVILLAGIGWYLESDYCVYDTSFLPWNLPSALFAISFYCTGNLLFPYLKEWLSRSKKYAFLVVMIIAAIIDVPLALYNGHVTLGSRHLSNGFIFYITGIVGTLGILSLSKLIQKSRFLKMAGKNSFYIMSTHIPFLMVYPILWSKVEKETGIALYNKDSIVECLVPFSITVIVCFIFSVVYVRIKNVILKGNH